MKDSQQEIKSTVTVNTSDIAAKAHEDKEQSKDLEKLAKKRGGKVLVRNCYFQSGIWTLVFY
jgi:inositol 1,4,5-triphosphate receptor type 1